MLDSGPLTRVLCVKCFFLDHLESYIKNFFFLPCLYLYQTCDITFDFIIMLGIKPVWISVIDGIIAHPAWASVSLHGDGLIEQYKIRDPAVGRICIASS